jgi:lipoic acid synthetase
MVIGATERPAWLKVRFPAGPEYRRLESLMRDQGLHTVCEEAHCPNIGDCWSRGTATFMILGDTCTRSCGFCAVKTGRPGTLDHGEPRRVALAVQQMGLRHAVITSVNRDELELGGSEIFAETIKWTRRLSPDTTIEVLIPDFKGNWDALATVMAAQPEILNHNVETVPRLYHRVRPQAVYSRSLELLERAKALDVDTLTKSGVMVGLGETRDELLDVFADMRRHNVEILTVGQYLRPTPQHLPVERYWHPGEFAELKERALEMGFAHVESGPLVRSSYHAEEQTRAARDEGQISGSPIWDAR